MKHHLADFLDRDDGHWTFTPNRQRYGQGIADAPDGSPDVVVATIGRDTTDWERVLDFPRLEELTLHEPSKEQFEAVGRLRSIRRLRVTHHRPKTIESLAAAVGVEEMILEYVSGFSDLSPLRALPRLRSVYFENLRRVKRFDGLAGCNELRYLAIHGTLDWDQPIHDFEFVEELPALEVLSAHSVRALAGPPVALPIARSTSLRRLRIMNQILTALDHAILEVGLPHVDGARFGPWELEYDKYHQVAQDDPRVEEARRAGRSVHQRYDGLISVADPETAWFRPTGRGARRFRRNGTKANERRCADVTARYDDLKDEARRLLGEAS
ncbi:MAG: leucine-rich repeat domain-containing protein [Planctomycetota bacterium]